MGLHDDLGNRMKIFYEQIPKTKLMRRTPVAIRVDGKAFRTFTRGFYKPFDAILMKAMQEAMKYLCSEIQGCVFGYTQSDEIILILIDYQKFTTNAWFDNEVQKICSVSASMATMAFNKFLRDTIENKPREFLRIPQDLRELYVKRMKKGALFDSRCFNIPKEEVANLIYWRQLDAKRNSIQMVGQANFSHKELQGKSCDEIREILSTKKNIDWDNDFITSCKYGTSCIKTEKGWEIDTDMPIIKGKDREYVDRCVYVGEGFNEYTEN